MIKKYLYYATVFLLIFSCSCEEDENEVDVNGKMHYGANVVSDQANGSFAEGERSNEKYNTYVENPFIKTDSMEVSTFSIDADGASYSNLRRYVSNGYLPPDGAVRTEEMINYFVYDYPEPEGDAPISLDGEFVACPWHEGNKLIRVGIKGKTIPKAELAAANIVLLVDVSGSMSDQNKLPLVKEGLKYFIDELREQDRLGIVTYAGSAGVVLQMTSGENKDAMKEAVDELGAGGSTAGAEGIVTAYEMAEQNLVPEGNNRVILATDGDFNVGISNQEELVELIEEEREKGIFLSVLGVGGGNLNDAMMEQVANNGNGTYEYIDNVMQAQKVFIHEYGKFYSVAKDVKIQVEFDTETIDSYRLIGYENRVMDQEDFEDDEKDAGEIGSGQTITALYEIVPKESVSSEMAFNIKFRYKDPKSSSSNLLNLKVENQDVSFSQATENTRFAASVAGFSMLLIDSEYKGDLSLQNVIDWASGAQSFDPHGYREGFVELLHTYDEIK